jgi:hypothetical protein
MFYYRKFKEVFDQPFSIEDHAAAMMAIREFQDNYRLSDCRQILWNLLVTGLTTENSFFTDDPYYRDEAITFVQHLEEIVEVIYFMYKNQK